MLEIIALISLCRHCSRLASERGHNGGVYAFFTAALWIGLELAGIVIGYFLGFSFISYFLGLAGAGTGALIGWFVASNLQNKNIEYDRGPLMPMAMPVNTFIGAPAAPKEPVWCIKCGRKLPPESERCDACGAEVPRL